MLGNGEWGMGKKILKNLMLHIPVDNTPGEARCPQRIVELGVFVSLQATSPSWWPGQSDGMRKTQLRVSHKEGRVPRPRPPARRTADLFFCKGHRASYVCGLPSLPLMVLCRISRYLSTHIKSNTIFFPVKTTQLMYSAWPLKSLGHKRILKDSLPGRLSGLRFFFLLTHRAGGLFA